MSPVNQIYITYRLYTGDITGAITPQAQLRLSVETAIVSGKSVHRAGKIRV